jgi:hypothetical protein
MNVCAFFFFFSLVGSVLSVVDILFLMFISSYSFARLGTDTWIEPQQSQIAVLYIA